MAEQEKGNINNEINYAAVGMNLDQTPMQLKKGVVTYALNAAVENFDANSITYQNEEGKNLNYHVSWTGYFERLESIDIKEVRYFKPADGIIHYH